MNNILLLHQALTHTSYANEARHIGTLHNERLEYLGDAVLDLIISEYLFKNGSQLTEGELTKSRANLVCENSLAQKSAETGLGDYLLLGKGEAQSGGKVRSSILADGLEALIGAVYLDQGYVVVFNMVIKLFSDIIALIEKGEYMKDFKTWLQEIAQRTPDNKIVYEVIDQSGPDHNKVFKIQVKINDRELGTGTGKSKKEAEQQAARLALIELNAIQIE